MYSIYVIVGQVITYCAIISGISACLATPFLFADRLWNIKICNMKITKYLIIIISTVITLSTTTVSIK